MTLLFLKPTIIYAITHTKTTLNRQSYFNGITYGKLPLSPSEDQTRTILYLSKNASVLELIGRSICTIGSLSFFLEKENESPFCFLHKPEHRAGIKDLPYRSMNFKFLHASTFLDFRSPPGNKQLQQQIIIKAFKQLNSKNSLPVNIKEINDLI